LKSKRERSCARFWRVALFTGAWIEIKVGVKSTRESTVALFTGAWIEIHLLTQVKSTNKVALFTGAWIEIATF